VIRDLLVLTKARVQVLALAVAGLAAWLACLEAGATLPPLRLASLLVGFALVCSAAAAMNQALEADVDARMARTAHRPVAAGRMQPTPVLAWAALAAVLGLLVLAAGTTPLAATLALAMLASYVFLYTPLKRVTVWNTVVGAFPGAMPVLVGWAAAGFGLDFVAGILFAILFLWQVPHFMAVAWIHREDYRRAGLRMLGTRDLGNRLAGHQAVSWALALVPVSLLPSLLGTAGMAYFAGALLLSVGFLAAALLFGRGGTLPRARLLLHSSLAYLPLLLALLAVDRAWTPLA